VPVTGGVQVQSREGKEQGSPSQAFPKWKSIGIVDLDRANFGATLIGRYVSKLEESNGNVLNAKFYTDMQLRWLVPSAGDNFEFALGVNNLFKTKTPGCITCETNNFAITAHDPPGRYVYARARVRM